MRQFFVVPCSLVLCVFGACTESKDSTSTDSMIIRFSGIPDSDKANLAKSYDVITKYLSDELGAKVEWVNADSYPGAVTALAANRIDLAWLGGVTSVQSEARTQNQVTFVACRESDLKFKSYIIANKSLIDSGTVAPVENLTDLKPMLIDRTFTFGSKSSTSGHIMPRHFMAEAGIDPDEDFSAPSSYQLQGGHSATLKAVSTGSVDMGALNYKTYDSASADLKTNAPVIFVTPEYVDYCLVAHNRLGDALISKIQTAFTSLDPNNPEDAKVLGAFSAENERFVAADPMAWEGIRRVLNSVDIQ